jgi:hypothetical protein
MSYNEDKNSGNGNAEMGTGELQGKEVNGKRYQEQRTSWLDRATLM